MLVDLQANNLTTIHIIAQPLKRTEHVATTTANTSLGFDQIRQTDT